MDITIWGGRISERIKATAAATIRPLSATQYHRRPLI